MKKVWYSKNKVHYKYFAWLYGEVVTLSQELIIRKSVLLFLCEFYPYHLKSILSSMIKWLFQIMINVLNDYLASVFFTTYDSFLPVFLPRLPEEEFLGCYLLI